MAANTDGVFTADLQKAIRSSKVLVVGAGGIGCELLKNLVMTGFQDIEIVDLDTIDVSNLNRQFLFHKKHVGKSKAEVARESVLKFNPKASIVAHHDSIISTNYSVNYFSKFNMVLNALDNRQARNHVNRVCLAAKVPLVESGTSGYSGQVELIVRGKTKCYECDLKPAIKDYPSCTIRNTPSELIHCIVWAKYLFNQLFGEYDADAEVSPDTADPEAAGDAGMAALEAEMSEGGNVERSSTRDWAQECNYDPIRLFTKLFSDDVKYLLAMKDLWSNRTPPKSLDWDNLPDANEGSSRSSEVGSGHMRVWTIAECAHIFAESLTALKVTLESMPDVENLEWDKDNEDAMDFVTAAANIRAHLFNIEPKSRFDIKSMAGNIIPAIATSNAIIAGMVVMHALNLLQDRKDKCQSVYLRQQPNHKGQLLVPEKSLIPPIPNCRVCSAKPQILFGANLDKITCKDFETNVLKKYLNMALPDVYISSSGNVVISSEPGETDHNDNRTLRSLGITDGSVLMIDDFMQNYELKVIMNHWVPQPNEEEFIVTGNADDLIPKGEDKPVARKEPVNDGYLSEDDDLIMDMGGEEEAMMLVPKKRKHEEADGTAKKRRTIEFSTGSASDPIVL